MSCLYILIYGIDNLESNFEIFLKGYKYETNLKIFLAWHGMYIATVEWQCILLLYCIVLLGYV